MSYNGSGLFQINTSGQPVVAGTVITASAFNALTADLATGLTTAITKDGQTATTAQIPFAQGLRSTLVTDSTTSTSGSIITDGGLGVAKAITAGLTITGTKLIPTGTSVTGNGMYLPAANTLGFSTNGTNAVNIDASQNVGVGVTPSAWSGAKAVEIGAVGLSLFNATGSANTSLGANVYYAQPNYKYATTAAATLYQQLAGVHYWFNAASGTAGNTISLTQAMTLDSSGNLLVGTTGLPNGTSIYGTALAPTSLARTIIYQASNSTGSAVLQAFYNPNGGVGSISTSGTSTAFTTSSDHRLKENIAPMTGALNRIAALKPVTYKWKTDGADGEGFIAHELAEVCPQAVVGEKDAVDEDGKPQYQGIDVSFLVATLTAAIQEQQSLIQSLTDRLTALEGAAK